MSVECISIVDMQVFCDPLPIPEDMFSLHLPSSTRGSKVRLSYRTTPLVVSETLCLAQGHLNRADLITVYGNMQLLLSISIINMPHAIDY